MAPLHDRPLHRLPIHVGSSHREGKSRRRDAPSGQNAVVIQSRRSRPLCPKLHEPGRAAAVPRNAMLLPQAGQVKRNSTCGMSRSAKSVRHFPTIYADSGIMLHGRPSDDASSRHQLVRSRQISIPTAHPTPHYAFAPCGLHIGRSVRIILHGGHFACPLPATRHVSSWAKNRTHNRAQRVERVPGARVVGPEPSRISANTTTRPMTSSVGAGQFISRLVRTTPRWWREGCAGPAAYRRRSQRAISRSAMRRTLVRPM